MSTKAAYDLPGAASEYSVSETYIRRAIKAGDLPAKRVGKKFSIPAAALAAWYESLPDA